MKGHYGINENVWIYKEICPLKHQRIHFKKTAGIIKGIKRCNKDTSLYLIEFLNHNRIWIIEKEIKKKYK
jgi:hypothetical protein